MSDFDKLLETADGRKQFMTFLKSQYADENLEFWLMVEHYKTMIIYNDRRSKKTAETIYTDYIRPNGNRTVNISARTQKSVLLNLKNLPLNLFNEAQNEIYILMKEDCFPRFINSKFAEEFKQLQLETPRLERKKKKARPFGTVVDYDSPHKVQRKSLLKPDDRYENYSKKVLETELDDSPPPQVPKRRESLSSSLEITKNDDLVMWESEKKSMLSSNNDIRAPLASVSETNLADNQSCYSMVVNSSFGTNPPSTSFMKEVKIILSDEQIVSETVPMLTKFSLFIQNLLKKHSNIKIGKDFLIVESCSGNTVDLDKTIGEYNERIFFLIKLIDFKIKFYGGVLLTIQCSSQKHFPAVISAILQKFKCDFIPEVLKSLVDKNNKFLRNICEEYENRIIVLSKQCEYSSLNCKDLKSLQIEECIYVKSIEYLPEFYSKTSLKPFNIENISQQINNGHYDYSVQIKQRPASMSFPVEYPDKQRMRISDSVPFSVSTNLVNSNSFSAKDVSIPVYENSFSGIYSKSQRNVSKFRDVEMKDEISNDLNLSDEFFENIMKKNYVKLRTVDCQNFDNRQLKLHSPISETHIRRESFHRANLAIVQNSPARRSNSLPRQSLGSSPERSKKQEITPTCRFLISSNKTPTSGKRDTNHPTSKTPSLMKTLSKFHKIY